MHNYQVNLATNKIDGTAPGCVPPATAMPNSATNPSRAGAPTPDRLSTRGQNYGASDVSVTGSHGGRGSGSGQSYGGSGGGSGQPYGGSGGQAYGGGSGGQAYGGGDYLGAPASPSMNQPDRRHRTLPNAPQHQQSQHQQQQHQQQQQSQHRRHYPPDVNGPSPYPGGRAPPQAAPHMSSGGYGGSGRASPSMARVSGSPGSQRSIAKQRNGNGRVPYEEVNSRSGGRRMEERW